MRSCARFKIINQLLMSFQWAISLLKGLCFFINYYYLEQKWQQASKEATNSLFIKCLNLAILVLKLKGMNILSVIFT